MTEPRISQAALFVLSNDVAADSVISQVAYMILAGPPDTPNLISQAAMFIMLSDARGIVTLRNAISLDCWQPCTSYGTFSKIQIIGN